MSSLKCISLYAVGPPSAPNINVVANADFRSFRIMIERSKTSEVCVKDYVLNVVENGGEPTAMVVGSRVPIQVGDLNLCNSTYSFSAYTTTSDVDGSLSDLIPGVVDFSGIQL